MAIVSDAKLKALASFIVNNEVNGSCACCSVLDQMPEEMQKEVNAPCKISDYEDEWCYDCPFYSKDGFLHWIKQDRKLVIECLKKPKKEDFLCYDNARDRITLEDDYVKALEKYCNDIKNVLANTEYDLEMAKCDNRELSDKLEQIRGVLDGND